jgi:hypothetical protein
MSSFLLLICFESINLRLFHNCVLNEKDDDLRNLGVLSVLRDLGGGSTETTVDETTNKTWDFLFKPKMTTSSAKTSLPETRSPPLSHVNNVDWKQRSYDLKAQLARKDENMDDMQEQLVVLRRELETMSVQLRESQEAYTCMERARLAQDARTSVADRKSLRWRQRAKRLNDRAAMEVPPPPSFLFLSPSLLTRISFLAALFIESTRLPPSSFSLL